MIRLPDKKCIVVDSKVSLADYERAVSAETVEESELALRAHVTAVKKHIDDLHGKDYATLDGIDSPDYVLMFMPIEPAFIEALKFDSELFAYGFNKNVVLVSHTTLIPILRTVCNLWILDQSNREVRELGDSAVDVWNGVVGVAKQVQDLGKSLNTAGRKYNDLVTKVVGQQGLSKKVERFSQMSNKTAVENVDDLGPIEICSEDLRLNLEAKPIEDDGELTPGDG